MLGLQVQTDHEERRLDVDSIKLFAGDHAIEDCTFGILFSEPLTSADYQRFSGRQNDISGEFASISDIQNFQFTFGEADPVVNQTSNGKRLAHYTSGGQMTWDGGFHSNMIQVSCKSYSRWENVWADARRKLKLLLDVVDSKKPVLSVDLLVTDSFSVEAPQKIRPVDLFNRSSKYIGEQILKIQDGRWDNQIGWFESDTPTQDKLIRFDTRAVRRNQEYVVTIVNLQSLRPSGNSEVLEDFTFGNLAKLDEIFSKFHDSNKKLLNLVLNNDVSKRMGL